MPVQALARLRFDTEVIQGDVDEAVRLMEASTRSLSDCAREKVEVDPVSAIFSARPATNRVLLFAARTLNATGQSRVALSLR